MAARKMGGKECNGWRVVGRLKEKMRKAEEQSGQHETVIQKSEKEGETHGETRDGCIDGGMEGRMVLGQRNSAAVRRMSHRYHVSYSWSFDYSSQQFDRFGTLCQISACSCYV